MGKSSSKFRKLIRNGEEQAAVQMLASNVELRKALDPNVTYKGSHDGDTPLHSVCRQNMKSLIGCDFVRHLASFLLQLALCGIACFLELVLDRCLM